MKPEGWHKCALLMFSVAAVAGCMEMHTAPVYNLGLRGDSSTGAMIVGSGDTLWSIAQSYRLPLRAIIDLNHLNPPYHLNSGQRLKLPPPMDYRVRSQDTLYSIARMFDVSVYKLVQHNNLAKPYTIRVGQSLQVPYSPAQQPVEVVTSHKSETKTSYKPKTTDTATVTKYKTSTVTRTKTKTRPAAVQVAGASAPAFAWPVRGKVISTYGPKEGGLYNEGINIAVPKHEPVLAAADGTVVYVGDALKSYGNLVLVRHSGGMTTAYAHLASIGVKKGQQVRQKQVIGRAGSTGNVSSTQLHFEIRKQSKTYDPLQYL